MAAQMTLVDSRSWRDQNNRRVGRDVYSLTGLTGGNDTIGFPSRLPSAPLAISYEGTAGSPASSWQASDANNLYVKCAGATATAVVDYLVSG